MSTKPKVTTDYGKPNYQAGQKVSNTWGGTTKRAPEKPDANLFTSAINTPVHQGLNFLTDVLTLGARNQRDAYGTGLGDLLYGKVSPGYYKELNAKPQVSPTATRWTGGWGGQNNSVVGGSGSGSSPSARLVGNPKMNQSIFGQGAAHDAEQARMMQSLSRGGDSDPKFNLLGLDDAYAQIQAMLSSMGISNSPVSYDPLRNQARSQWSDADARTKAMYDQLQASIGAESGNINQVFDAGIADTNAATKFATDQQNASQQSLTDMQTQQAKALGIEEAVANNINSGNNAADDAAARQAANTARGQITSNQLTSNRATAQTGISNLVGAAGLQGVMDRTTRQNELQRLLAQYDVDEQKANAEQSSAYQSQMNDGIWKLLGLNRDDAKEWDLNQYHATQEGNDYSIAQQKLLGSGSGNGKYTRDSAFQAALDDYGYTADQLVNDTNKRAQVLKAQQFYMKL